LQYMGVNTEWKEEEILIEHEIYDGTVMVVESDWSMASYWYQMLALSQKGSIELKGLKAESFQCDTAVKDIFKKLGVETLLLQDSIKIKRKGKPLKKFQQDFTNSPDLIPAVVVTCVCMDIPFRITGLESLRAKEPDRVISLQTELSKVGAKITVELEDKREVLVFDGKTKFKGLKSVEFETYNDHRMALSLAPICLKGINVTIVNPWVTNKSYPAYWDDLKKMGFEVNS